MTSPISAVSNIAALADKLSAQQAPLKAQYRQSPDTAKAVLTAHARLVQEVVGCDVDTSNGVVRAGLHAATGGDGTLACSGDMLLEALVGCAGVTLAAVATAIGVTLNNTSITAEGDLDFRGTLGVDKSAPVGFSAIRVIYKINTEATDAQLDTLKKLTERYCVVYQTLSKGVAIEGTFQRH